MNKTIFTFPVLLFYTIFLWFGVAYSQSMFQETIGGTNIDGANFILQTTDSGFAAVGNTHSFGAGGSDCYIVKLNDTGTLQWSRTVGGTNNDLAFSIIRTTDGGYALTGYTNSFGAGQNDIYIVKLGANGTLQWSKTVGGTGLDEAHSIIQTTDGGYVVAGYTNSFGTGQNDMYIVKLDANGTLQWNKTVGGNGLDEARSIKQSTDGGYVVAGTTGSFGAGVWDMFIVKLDSGGTLQWSKTAGGTGEDDAQSIIQTTDGGYAVAGNYRTSPFSARDMYIVKLDVSGTLQWSRTVGGTGYEWALSIFQTTDGGYAVAGNTNFFGAGGTDFYIVKLDSAGTPQWSKTAGGSNGENLYSIIQTTDNGFVAAGSTLSFGAGNYDMYIVKLDVSGNTCANSTSPTSSSGTGGTINTSTPTITSPTPTVTTPSSTTSTGGTVTTLCTTVGVGQKESQISKEFTLGQNYPNPFNPTTSIKFSIPVQSFTELLIYDLLGKEVAALVNEELQPGNYEVEWEASAYSSGVYFYKLKSGGFVLAQRMVLIK